MGLGIGNLGISISFLVWGSSSLGQELSIPLSRGGDFVYLPYPMD